MSATKIYDTDLDLIPPMTTEEAMLMLGMHLDLAVAAIIFQAGPSKTGWVVEFLSGLDRHLSESSTIKLLNEVKKAINWRIKKGEW